MRQILDWSKPYHRFFEEMARIPHGSHHEKEYSDYLVKFAKERGLRYRQYEIGNVILYKDASPGYEDHPIVVMQAHMDMVCEKIPESGHDFEKDPLDLYIEDGWLHAGGTTLGADDGAGVAYILSVLDDQETPHPSLECVFTVQEEVGLDGAFALDPGDLKGRRYISLDDGSGGVTTTTASAGGMGWQGIYGIKMKSCGKDGYRLIVGGLQGGHSGGCIDQERGNAIKICVRILKVLQKQGQVTLSYIEGGSKDNAIPRDCQAEFVTGLDGEKVHNLAEKMAEVIRKELCCSDSGLTVTVEKSVVNEVLEQGDSDHLLDFLYLCPHGMRHRSMELEGLPTASENLAVVHTMEDGISISVSLRAANESFLDDMAEELKILASLYHISYEESSRYPAWDYEENSYMREVMAETVRDTMGIELAELAVHGGLECGVFKKKWPDMDMVTLGPVSMDAHSPDERLDLKSFDECYGLLKEFLRRL